MDPLAIFMQIVAGAAVVLTAISAACGVSDRESRLSRRAAEQARVIRCARSLAGLPRALFFERRHAALIQTG